MNEGKEGRKEEKQLGREEMVMVVSAQTVGSFKRSLDGFKDGDERWM